MVLNPEERVDRTPQEPRPQSPFEDLPGNVDITGPEKTPPPSPRDLPVLDQLPTLTFTGLENEGKSKKPRSSRTSKGERDRKDSSRSRDKKGRSGSEHKRKEGPRKPRTPQGAESPGKVSYERIRRKTDGEDTHGASEVVNKYLEKERDKLTTPIVDVNNGEVKKEVANFNAKNSSGDNNNFNKVFVANPALENGPPTPKNLLNSVSSNGSMASHSTEAPASPMTNSAPPTPVNDMPMLQESFNWRKGELIGSVSPHPLLNAFQ